jgi:hypothetical protein
VPNRLSQPSAQTSSPPSEGARTSSGSCGAETSNLRRDRHAMRAGLRYCPRPRTRAGTQSAKPRVGLPIRALVRRSCRDCTGSGEGDARIRGFPGSPNLLTSYCGRGVEWPQPFCPPCKTRSSGESFLLSFALASFTSGTDCTIAEATDCRRWQTWPTPAELLEVGKPHARTTA